MGLFNFGRRKNEDALAQARSGSEAETAPPAAPGMPAPAPSITGEHGEQIGAPPPAEMAGFSVEGLQNMGALGPLIQQAIDNGHAQVYSGAQVTNMVEHGQEMQKEIMDVLAKHGIDAQAGSGQSIPLYDPNMMNEIFGVLGKYGMNPMQGMQGIAGMQGLPGAQPPTTPPPEPPTSG